MDKLTKNKIKALKLAKKDLKAWGVGYAYICVSLDDVTVENPKLSEAVKLLKEYIRRSLGSRITLGGWQLANGIKNTEKGEFEDRLAWVDWMITSLKNKHPVTQYRL